MSAIVASTIPKVSNEENSECLSKSIICGNKDLEKAITVNVQNEYEERRQQLQYQQALLHSQSEQHLSYNQQIEHAGALNSSLRTDTSQTMTVDSAATTMFNSAAYFTEDPAADRLFAVTNP